MINSNDSPEVVALMEGAVLDGLLHLIAFGEHHFLSVGVSLVSLPINHWLIPTHKHTHEEAK